MFGDKYFLIEENTTTLSTKYFNLIINVMKTLAKNHVCNECFIEEKNILKSTYWLQKVMRTFEKLDLLDGEILSSCPFNVGSQNWVEELRKTILRAGRKTAEVHFKFGSM